MRYLLAILIILIPACVEAKPLVVSQNGGVTVTLTDEPCALAGVKNLAGRVTWLENGKISEGCYGMFGPLVLAYFDDLTVVPMNIRLFVPAQES